MPVFVDQDGGSCVVRCVGEIDIALAGEVKEALLGGVAQGGALQVDMRTAVEAHITTLQLVWAARREVRGAGRAFSLIGPLPEALLAAIDHAGLDLTVSAA